MISMPTYNSYAITKQTLKRLLRQKEIQFDIVLINNGGEDYKSLMKDFPDINYIVLEKNVGGGGAQRIGAEFALKMGYEFIVMTDNDAILLQSDGLAKLYKKISSDLELGGVAPNHCDSPIKKDILWKKQLCFHYLFVRCSFLRTIELHNFFIYMVTDDVSFVSKIVSNTNLLICHSIKYYHEAFKPKFLQNYTIYFGIRGFLIILFLEKNISFRLKLYHFFHLFYYPLIAIAHSLILWDVSYIKTIFLSIYNFLTNYQKIDLAAIPKNKYVFAESRKPLSEAVSMTTFNSIFLKREYYWYSNYFKKKQYYRLVKNND